jgi:hypothetical protein
MCEGVECGLRILGYPGKYNPAIKAEMAANSPKLFICGHSHYFEGDVREIRFTIWTLALAKKWFSSVRTMLRFVIEGDKIKDLEIIEIEKRA